MPTPREQQIDLSLTPYYHCVSRCVRRAYLCGDDRESGKNFDHRKTWLVEKMKYLTEYFAIEICAFAVLSNHYHLVLRVDQERAQQWPAKEVIERWATLFPQSKAASLKEKGLQEIDLDINEQINTWRKQLSDISWFMRVLNEGIARRANKEDNCRGRFWESRFKSQALLDESALLTCMAYVDLNPIRAQISETPEESDFTSIKERIEAYQKRKQPKQLAPLQSQQQKEDRLPIDIQTYFELVDTSGRVLREGKHGSIPDSLQPILQRIEIQPTSWLETLNSLEQQFETFIGKPESLKIAGHHRGSVRVRGVGQAKRVFREAA